ncbi:hypothetical protein Tco_0337895, partial [Tanacetum coccineum]
YHEGALVFEKDSEGAPINPEPPTCRRKEYIPSTDPSSRFPHMNVRVFPTSQEMYLCHFLKTCHENLDRIYL